MLMLTFGSPFLSIIYSPMVKYRTKTVGHEYGRARTKAKNNHHQYDETLSSSHSHTHTHA